MRIRLVRRVGFCKLGTVLRPVAGPLDTGGVCGLAPSLCIAINRLSGVTPCPNPPGHRLA